MSLNTAGDAANLTLISKNLANDTSIVPAFKGRLHVSELTRHWAAGVRDRQDHRGTLEIGL
jgi:hypothetical protein